MGQCNGKVALVTGGSAAVSIASFRHSLPSYCTPIFIARGRELQVQNIRHPLVRESIGNSFQVKDRSALIYGPNMSGKTTFIRSIALAALLGQTVCTCLADVYQGPFLVVKTFINRQDDILGGQSYFQEEVNAVKELIQSSTAKAQHMLLIDELFKGTSPQESNALSYAVLEYLDVSDSILLVATHDVDLQKQLKKWAVFHFREVSENKALAFDYKIREGMTISNTAIKLLELADYPQDIIRFAKRNLGIHPEE